MRPRWLRGRGLAGGGWDGVNLVLERSHGPTFHIVRCAIGQAVNPVTRFAISRQDDVFAPAAVKENELAERPARSGALKSFRVSFAYLVTAAYQPCGVTP